MVRAVAVVMADGTADGVCCRQEYIRVLQKTLCETKLPLSIVEECLMQREKRLGIECTHDEPERTLCKVRYDVRSMQYVETPSPRVVL